MGHAIFAPSSAHRWSRCPGSAVLAYMYPPAQTTSPAAERGTRLHALAAYYLRHGEYPPGTSAENREIVDGYAHALDVLRREMGGDPDLRVEHYSSAIFAGSRDCAGTADAIILGDIGCTVVDLKTGYQRVEAKDNEQLMLYAYASAHYGDRAARQNTPITMAIYQPYADPDPLDVLPGLTTWTISYGELREAVARMRYVVMSLDDIRETITHPRHYAEGEHCRYCPVMASCPVLKDKGLRIASQQPPFEDPDGIIGAPGSPLPAATPWPERLAPPDPPNPMTLMPQQVAHVMQHSALVREWLDAVEDSALRRAMSGETIPGWKPVESATRRRVRDDAALIAEGDGRYDIYAKKLKPLSELEKILPRDVFARHVEKPSGAPVLVPENDKRPALVVGADLSLPPLAE